MRATKTRGVELERSVHLGRGRYGARIGPGNFVLESMKESLICVPRLHNGIFEQLLSKTREPIFVLLNLLSLSLSLSPSFPTHSIENHQHALLKIDRPSRFRLMFLDGDCENLFVFVFMLVLVCYLGSDAIAVSSAGFCSFYECGNNAQNVKLKDPIDHFFVSFMSCVDSAVDTFIINESHDTLNGINLCKNKKKSCERCGRQPPCDDNRKTCNTMDYRKIRTGKRG
jgi:hypothetical protein